MAMRPAPCPRHYKRGGTMEDCPFCEAEAERQEMVRDEPEIGTEESDRAADAYERWIESSWP